jgi:hypothetical protein
LNSELLYAGAIKRRGFYAVRAPGMERGQAPFRANRYATYGVGVRPPSVVTHGGRRHRRLLRQRNMVSWAAWERGSGYLLRLRGKAFAVYDGEGAKVGLPGQFRGLGEGGQQRTAATPRQSAAFLIHGSNINAKHITAGRRLAEQQLLCYSIHRK